MKQRITLISNTFGAVNIAVKPGIDENTFQIGYKRINFSPIVPKNIDLRTENFDIIIFEGVYLKINVIIGSENYLGEIRIIPAKSELMLVHSR